MQKRTVYFENVDAPNTIVRKRSDRIPLEYISPGNPVWTETRPNSSYEREYYLAQGNCCLFPISEEEAMKRLTQWGLSQETIT